MVQPVRLQSGRCAVMAGQCCPACGRAMPTPKARKIACEPLTDERRATMSDAEIHAHYKATAHVEDVRFNIKHGIVDDMPAELASEWRALLADAESGRIKRAETHRRLWRLSERWGRIQNLKDPAISRLFAPPKPGLKWIGATPIGTPYRVDLDVSTGELKTHYAA